MNRLCPDEKILSEYLAGFGSDENRATLEEHLASCKKCRKLICEAHELITAPDIKEQINIIKIWIKGNKWLIASILLLLFSFLVREYFLQLLVGAVIAGSKWIIDSKTTKMLITVHKALQEEKTIKKE